MRIWHTASASRTRRNSTHPAIKSSRQALGLLTLRSSSLSSVLTAKPSSFSADRAFPPRRHRDCYRSASTGVEVAARTPVPLRIWSVPRSEAGPDRRSLTEYPLSALEMDGGVPSKGGCFLPPFGQCSGRQLAETALGLGGDLKLTGEVLGLRTGVRHRYRDCRTCSLMRTLTAAESWGESRRTRWRTAKGTPVRRAP